MCLSVAYDFVIHRGFSLQWSFLVTIYKYLGGVCLTLQHWKKLSGTLQKICSYKSSKNLSYRISGMRNPSVLTNIQTTIIKIDKFERIHTYWEQCHFPLPLSLLSYQHCSLSGTHRFPRIHNHLKINRFKYGRCHIHVGRGKWWLY